MDSAEIRARFLRFFEQRGHTVVDSASLILDDPTLLFVNAGMVPFKPYFLGEETVPYSRATSVQKCVRTLDIEEVGKTTRHGSFFQMAGNFAFADYFKSTAIPYAWELLTGSVAEGGFGLDPQRLWATVYLDDDEAAQIWHEVVGLPKERIQRRGKADNFWSMGVPGPCGPCSEIYYDRGPEFGPDGGPVADEDRYLEVWNLVFMQNERGASGDGNSKDDFPIIGDLPAKNIDTGLGLERMAAILQGVDNIYEIDTSRAILDRASALSGSVYGSSAADDIALRVVADHARTAVFMIADGVTPGNEGRGYVLRRIIRRVINKMRLLGSQDPVMPPLVATVVATMSAQYPDLIADEARIAAIAANEEAAFMKTLKSGTTIFEQTAATLQATGRTVVPGDKAFLLHDTYGFPIDLTLEIAQEAGLDVDQEGFRALMLDQRARGKQDARQRKAGLADLSVYRDLLESNGATEWMAYDGLNTPARVVGILANGQPAPVLTQGQVGTIMLDRTTFYAESGGQHADAGTIEAPGVALEVLDVQRPVKGLVAHQVRVVVGELVLDQEVEAKVDPDWRRDARQAHSGTHVVHAAIREVLGSSATQSGSFNRPGYLRLDFSWGGALDQQQRNRVEEVSNRAVRDDLPVSVEYMSVAEAKDHGALALFGETYGQTVRVVDIGGPWSSELCGGTHVAASSQIGPIAVTSESSVGSGARRIEATVGLPAFEYLARERDLVAQLTEQLNVNAADLPGRVASIVARLKETEKELDKIKSAQVLDQVQNIMGNGTDIGKFRLWTFQAPESIDGGALRQLAMRARDMTQPDRSVGLIGASVTGDRVAMVATVNKQGLSDGLSAGEMLATAMPSIEGRGGGKPDMAQGGGSNAAGIPEAFAAVHAYVAGVAGVAHTQ